ncbi:hypothetical protein [Mycoplana ramosa]|uniref:Uncharacterized protein n=1 Tax=Mycoplana ramosa TaxID=40837 RepID=A0ABW3YWK8_MYCRA
MKYNQPYGNPDANAGYVDRNAAGAVAGSRVPAMAIEAPQREIMAVINAAGIAGSNSDLTQLLQAIQQLIAAATGGAGDPNYVLMTQARTRIPIFPQVLTATGVLPVVAPTTGLVRVPAGYEFLHRGIFLITTVQTDFVTVANKTYHLRWSPSAGFALKDLASAAYNPSAFGEGNEAFDSSYDDMLVSRVVTSAANVPTVTNLANKDRLSQMIADAGPMTTSPGASGALRTATLSWNWARRPLLQVTPVWFQIGPGGPGYFAASQIHDHDFSIAKISLTRYGASVNIFRDYATEANIEAFITA